MKFRHLIEHLMRIEELKQEIEEVQAPYVDVCGQAQLPVHLYKHVMTLQQTLETYLNCDVEQPSK